MKLNRFFTALLVGCVLLLQTGCEESAQVTEKPKTDLKPAEMVTVQKPTVPEKPHEPTVATETPTTEPKPSKPGPRIRFEKKIHDFGQVGPASKNICEFKFRNTGDDLLKIKNIRKSCGCTPFSLKKKEYAPGQTGTVKVTYNASTGAGKAQRTLSVFSNDKKSPQVILTIKAAITLKVRHQPSHLNLVLKDKNAGCPPITLTSVDGKPFAIKSFRTPGNGITASFDSKVEKTKFVLEPKISIEKLKKYSSGFIKIRLTHPQCKSVNVPFNAVPRFQTAPLSIMTSNVEPQKPIQRELWVLNNYNEDFEIESVSSQKDTIKVLKQEKVENRFKFVLEITPPPLDDKQSMFTDVLYVNIKDGEKLRIDCRGLYARKKKESVS
ncbi:MAG: DUF1573 domain-containing protein [Planctomycetota bacterium]|jgi:hypothetical protein